MLNEIEKIDSNFNEGMFITKVNNIFVMLHTAIMMGDLNRVKHFLSNEVYEKYVSIVNDLNNRNVRQMYDELNVANTTITDAKIENDKEVINVIITSRYMDYLVDKESGNFISGINDHRVEKKYYLTFEKYISSSYNGIARKCPHCGRPIDVNNSGYCEYCGGTFNTSDYDFILTKIDNSGFIE